MTRTARVAVAHGEGRFVVAVVIENEPGYAVDPAIEATNAWSDANVAAEEANAAAGTSPEEAWRIIETSMSASRDAGRRWGPRGS